MTFGVEFKNITKRYGTDPAAPFAVKGVSFGIEKGTLGHHPRPLGLRQDHRAADDLRSRIADFRTDLHGRPRRNDARPGRTQRQHDVPELRAVPAHERGRKRHVRTAHVRRAEGTRPRARRRDAAERRPRRLRRADAERALRRAAAARGARARADPGTADPALRRTAFQPRRPPAPRHARGNPRHPAAPEAHCRLRDARPERGAGGQRRDHRDERRPDRPERHAAGGCTNTPAASSSPASWAKPCSSPASPTRTAA